MGGGRDLFGRRKDGSCIPVEVGLNAIQTTAGPFVLASIVDITEKRRYEEEHRRNLNDRLEFERLLAELSAKFVNLSVEQIDQAIEEAQHGIADVLGLDRGILFQLSDDKADVISTHYWSRAEETQPTQHVSGRDLFPWSWSKILKGEIALFSSVDEVPDAVERESFSLAVK
jgi:hypothetical protein